MRKVELGVKMKGMVVSLNEKEKVEWLSWREVARAESIVS